MRAFPDTLTLPRALRAAGAIDLPGSKSLSNRYLVLAALAEGTTTLRGLLDSDDTAVMLDSLARLGVRIEREGELLRVQGCRGNFPVRRASLFVGNSGLSVRTLVPAVAAALARAGEGEVELSGVHRMHERPIGDLVDGLRAQGARIEYLGREGFPPLRVHAAPLSAGALRVRGDTSSQFLTGLLQAAPLVAVSSPVVIEVEGELISKPYVHITLALMERFGVRVRREDWRRFTVEPGQRYVAPGELTVEGDASSASYFLAAGAIGGGPVRVRGAGRASVQGDVRFADALQAMGARIEWGEDWIEARAGDGPLRGIELDCNAIPDAAMTLAACALHADGATLLRGIGSWRVKETDRIAAMATELRRFGALVEEGPDWLRVTPPERLSPATVDTYDDHRMAMCLSLSSIDGKLRQGVEVTVREPRCVAKTFPDFFERLADVTTPATGADGDAVPVITIDGPTASGKGTIAQRVATRLGWHYLDSGALYRLLALAALRAGTSVEDETALVALAGGLAPTFRGGRILLDGDDVTDAIRAEEVGEAASRLAALPGVRTALVALQRASRRSPGLVADGRDMGTVIFPDASLKVFLTASAESRAERRHKQLIDKGFPAKFDDLLRDLRARDHRDSSRVAAPLKPAEGAFVLDSTPLSIDQTVDAVLDRFGREDGRSDAHR